MIQDTYKNNKYIVYMKNSDEYEEHIRRLCNLYKENNDISIDEIYKQAVTFDFKWGIKPMCNTEE